MISFPSTARERARRSSARPFRIARREIRNLTEMGRDTRAGSFLLRTFVFDESRMSNTRARERAGTRGILASETCGQALKKCDFLSHRVVYRYSSRERGERKRERNRLDSRRDISPSALPIPAFSISIRSMPLVSFASMEARYPGKVPEISK